VTGHEAATAPGEVLSEEDASSAPLTGGDEVERQRERCKTLAIGNLIQITSKSCRKQKRNHSLSEQVKKSKC
jgi:hypothetical protein